MSDESSQEVLAQKKRDYLEFLDSKDGEYTDRIRKMIDSNSCRLILNLNDLRNDDTSERNLAKDLLKHPFDEIPALEQAIKESVETIDSQYAKKHDGNFFVALEGNFGGNHVTPRGLSATLLGQLCCVEGIVSKAGLIHPKVVKSVHYCPDTTQSLERTYRDATSIEGLPTMGLYPKEDDEGHPLVTEYGLSTYKDHQNVTIQEMPERAPTGQLPRSVDVILDNDLTDSCKPGDRVQLVGIFRALPNKTNGGTKGVFRTVLICNHVSVLGKESLMPTLTANDIKNITKIAGDKKQSAFELLAKSLAPSIYGNERIKEGLLAMLLGGEEKNLLRGGHIRGDINMLMVGDPSCGKSQMLRFVKNLAPHCITTTGRGSSGVGLTAAVTTDQDTGERRLEAGAMVLADRGIVCIDEFDKMSDVDRVSIHEVMEQQTVTIAKAGIHTSLNARCSVLAAANPVYGQYNPAEGPEQNVALPDSLLSRFDLLFIMLDKMDPNTDRTLAEHVLRSHCFRTPGEADGEVMRIEKSTDVIVTEDPDTEDARETSVYATAVNTGNSRQRRNTRQRTLSVEFARKYILYAKARCHPVLSNEAAQYIASQYTEIRDQSEKHRTLPVTARTLETMIRISTAHAKSRLAEKVEEIDARQAVSLLKYAYYNEATPVTGSKPDGKNGDGDGMDDDSDDDDDASGSAKTPKGKGKGGKTPKKSAKKPTGKSTRSPGSAGKKQKGKSKKDPADPFAFQSDDEDEEVGDAVEIESPKQAAAKPTPKRSARKPNAASASPAQAKEASPAPAAESPKAESPVEVAKKIEPTPEQLAAVRTVLGNMYKELRAESVEKDQLMEQLEQQHPSEYNKEEVDVILELMAEDNEVMVVDDQVIKI